MAANRLRELVGCTNRLIADPKPLEIGGLIFRKILWWAQEKRDDVTGARSPCSAVAGGACIALLNMPGCNDDQQGHRCHPARLPDEVRTFRSRPELSPPAVVPTGSGASEVGARGAAEQVLSGARNRLNNCLTERVLQHLGAMPSLKSSDAAA
jgi:hypothetical protein